LPLLSELIPGLISYGTRILVEFQPDSLWYETSFTIAANALKTGMRVDYHSLVRTAEEVKGLLARLGVDISELEQAGILTIEDGYTTQIGLSVSEESGMAVVLVDERGRLTMPSDLQVRNTTATLIPAGLQTRLSRKRLKDLAETQAHQDAVKRAKRRKQA